jgi:hypothetical protein
MGGADRGSPGQSENQSLHKTQGESPAPSTRSWVGHCGASFHGTRGTWLVDVWDEELVPVDIEMFDSDHPADDE